MKKAVIIVLLLIFFTGILYSYQFRIIKEPEDVLNHVGFVNLPDEDKYDINGELCGMLIVRTGIEEMNIDSEFRHKIIPKEGEYWVILQNGTRYVDLKKIDYVTYEVEFNKSIGKIESGKVYKMSVDGDDESEFVMISIISDPEKAEKWLDGELLGNEESYSIKKGKHELEMKYENYKTYVTTIDVDEDNFLFKDIELEIQRPVMLTITSEPQGAELYLDGVKEGVTNIQTFRFPKEYDLRLILDKYNTVEEKITVQESGDNIWHYNLMKITSILTIDATPSNADIYINNQKLIGKSKEVPAGKYLIEILCDDWYPESRNVTVESGKNKQLSFELKQKTGSLQVMVNPMEARSLLNKNDIEIDNWTGSKYIEELPIGNYKINTSMNGYQTETTEVKIKEKEISSTKVNLTPTSIQPVLSSSNVEMIFVKGGSYQMSSNVDDEKLVHSVTVSDFYIGKYEITQEQYKKVMGKNPSSFQNAGKDAPVEQVSWYDAVEFCNKLSDIEGLNKCYSGSEKSIKCDFSANGYRLPAEAEWEYAARGGKQGKKFEYSGSNNLRDVGWYKENSKNKTHSIGSKKSNELKLYDMSGNVWEWCWDWNGSYNSDVQTDPRGPSSGSRRVSRGGGWCDSERISRTTYRYNFNPAFSYNYIGFRIARSIPMIKKCFPEIYFDYDEYKINDDDIEKLNCIVNDLKTNQFAKILLYGYADGFGLTSYNYEISYKRAKSIKEYLGTHGINESDIFVLALGSNKPYYDKVEERKLNRKVKIELLNEGVELQSIAKSIYFESGKEEIPYYCLSSLELLAYLIKQNNGMIIEVAVYSDNIGSEESNRDLTQKRSDAIRDYLIGLGCNPIYIKSKGYGEDNPLMLNETAEGREMNRRTEIKIIEDPSKIAGILDNVNFESGISKLSRESYSTLNVLAGKLNANPHIKIEICGYTDNSGNETDNLDLSQKRADSIANYLISAGISQDRIISTGYGSSNPISDNFTFEGRAKNRRIVIKIIDY